MAGDYTTALKAARPDLDTLPQEIDVQVVVQHAGRQEIVTLQRRRTIFGRGDADVVVEDPTMSRKHFQVEVVRGGVVLHDLASANGTIFRGRWVTVANMKDGDSFQAGDTRFRIVIRTTNMLPARLLVVTALDEEEAGALARLLDNGVFAVRSVSAANLLETCRLELPEIVMLDGNPRDLGLLEQLKKVGRLKATQAIALLSADDAHLSEKFLRAGANKVLERPVSTQTLQTLIEDIAENPLTLSLALPATIRIGGQGEFQTRLASLHALGARLRFVPARKPEPGTPVHLKLMLPNEYGVVQIRGEWVGSADDASTVRFTAYEGNGQVVVRRMLRDLADTARRSALSQ